MKFQLLLSTAITVLTFFATAKSVIAQPLAPVQTGGQSSGIVPASGDARVAAPPRARASDNVYEPTTVMATVGSEYILAGDLMPQVEIIMWLMFKDRPKEELDRHRKELEEQKKILMQNLLLQAIDSKLLFLAFKRSMKPEELEQFEERAEQIVNSAFVSSMEETLPLVKKADKQEMKRLRAKEMQIAQLCTLMVEHEVETLRELDGILRSFGSSLEHAKQSFAETTFGRQAIALDVKLNYEITHQAMLDYYYENLDDYRISEAVSFEQLAVEFKNHKTKQQAYQKICALGNSVLQGAPFENVAMSHSEGPKAKTGGKYDLIEKGDLVSEKLEAVAFELPVNRMSPVIEDEKGFYIIRVTMHRPEGKENFTEVQSEIEVAMKNQLRNEAVQTYIKKVKTHVPVWNRLEQKKP